MKLVDLNIGVYRALGISTDGVKCTVWFQGPGNFKQGKATYPVTKGIQGTVAKELDRRVAEAGLSDHEINNSFYFPSK